MIAVTVLAIPMYFGLMAIELAYEAITKKKTYRLSDAITNISTGTLQQTTGVFFEIIKIFITNPKITIYPLPSVKPPRVLSGVSHFFYRWH